MGSSPRARFSVTVGSAVLMAWLAGGIACYRPNIGDGTLGCAAGGVCPDGFRCGGQNLCFLIGRDAGIPPLSDGGDAPMDQAVEAMPDTGGDTDGNPDRPDACFEARPACTPSDAGMCDPFCQTGCMGCNRKCSVNTDRELTCNESSGARGPMSQCTIQSEGSSNQTDNCQPGLVCLLDACGSERCHQFCRSDSDCANAPCTWDVGGGHRACDKPFVDCVPLAGNANVGCGGGNSVCYLSTSHPTRTICDCIGFLTANVPCQRSRECIAGLVCVDPNGEGTKCIRVCRLDNAAADCPPNQTCRPYRGPNPNSDAHSTYGYCFP